MMFLVWLPELGEDREWARLVRASDEKHAALRWAERFDGHGDCDIVNGDAVLVAVCSSTKPPDSPAWYFRVTGEAVPTYTAVEVEDEEVDG